MGRSRTTDASGRRLLVFWAGRHQREPWETLCADYRRRIEHDLPVEDRLIKVGGSGDDPRRREAEGEALLDALPDPCWSIALDPRGKALSSRDLAEELLRLRREWPHPVAFLVGSDLGLSKAVRRAARRRISFGKMVFGHELARLVLYEQVYRALSMSRGIKYHRS